MLPQPSPCFPSGAKSRATPQSTISPGSRVKSWNVSQVTCGDPRAVGRSELEEVEASPLGTFLKRMKDRSPPIGDVAEATSWWARFGKLASSRRAEELALAAAGELHDGPAEPYRAPRKVGRNEPCPCGSGKKYKKCCRG